MIDRNFIYIFKNIVDWAGDGIFYTSYWEISSKWI